LEWAGAWLLLVCLLIGFPAPASSASAASKPAELTDRALRFMHGEGVKPDIDRAVVYLCAAARKGYGPAAYELGWLYLQGRGSVARDDQLGAAWMQEAVRLGEQPPARLMQSLASTQKTSLACVASNGLDPRQTNARRAEFMLKIHEMAPKYDLDPALVLEVVRAESNFNPRARSHKGALGLMQLIPATARRFGVKDPYDPVQNLRGGMAYLRWLQERFDGDLRLTLAGYNAGEAAVERHGGVPPYDETRAYVVKILARYAKGPKGKPFS
ncbi:MAG: transglycosylase SLT domain-containing protein, partial [Gammaproteobacteria bacterium]|nr:transglycosylase SLT domain-containing protein [Gammaproteobacteria bacterium]